MKESTKKHFSIFILLLLFAIVACNHIPDNLFWENTLNDVESYMDNYPDSALATLNDLKKAQLIGTNESVKINQRQEAHFCLLLTIAKDKTYTPIVSDSIINIACDYYLHSRGIDDYDMARAHFYLGQVNFALNEYEKAATNYYKALAIIKPYIYHKGQKSQHSLQKYYKLTGLIYGNIAKTLFKNGLYDKTLKMSKDAYHCYAQAKDSTNMIYSLRNIGRDLSMINEYDSAKTYFERAIDFANKMHYATIANSLFLDLSQFYYLFGKKDYDSAILYTKKALSFHEQNLSGEMSSVGCYNLLGAMYFHLNEYDSALFYSSKVLSVDEPAKKITALAVLYEIEKARGNYKKATEYADEYIQNEVMLANSLQKDKVTEVTTEYENQTEIVRLQKDIANERLIYFLIAICGLLLILAAFLAIKNRIRKKTLENEQLSNRIARNEDKINQLVSELAEQYNKSGTANVIKSDIPDNKRESLIKSLLKNNAVYKNAEAYAQTGKYQESGINEEEWESIVSTTDMIYDNFSKRIKEQFPKFTKWDMRICCMLKLGFTHNMIAKTINATTATFSKRKTRMKHTKMELVNDDRTLEEIINNL